MLFVPYSSTIETMRPRRPVRIEATVITTVTPMTMPSTVRKLRSLFARTMPSAMAMVSVGMIDRSFISVFVQRDNRVEPRRLVRRIDTCDQPDSARHPNRQQYIDDCDRHRECRRHAHAP